MPMRDGRTRTTPMADERDAAALRGDLRPGDAGRDRAVLPRSLHTRGTGDDLAPVGSGEAAGQGAAVRGDRPANGRIDGDRNPRGALAAARRRRLPAGARPDVLKVAVPAKGRL